MRNAQALARDLPNLRRFDGVLGFAHALDSSDEQVVIVIGHNEGGILRTPAGYWLDIGAAADVCGTYGKLCIFLSCDSGEYLAGRGLGVDRELGLVEGVSLARAIRKQLQREPVRDGVLKDPYAAMENLSNLLTSHPGARVYGKTVKGVLVLLAISVPASMAPE